MSGLIKAQLNDVSGSNSYIFTPDIKIRWAYEKKNFFKHVAYCSVHDRSCIKECKIKFGNQPSSVCKMSSNGLNRKQ